MVQWKQCKHLKRKGIFFFLFNVCVCVVWSAKGLRIFLQYGEVTNEVRALE